MSRRAPRPIAQALRELTSAARPATTLARVQEVWPAAAGTAISAAASPTSERDGVLTVTCSAAVWSQELDMMADELISRLNLALHSDAIRELRCRTA